MPKKHQQRPAKEHVGRNNPEKSTEITTGLYKKQETSRREALEHKDPAKTAQDAHVPATFDHNPGLTHLANSQARTEDPERRS